MAVGKIRVIATAAAEEKMSIASKIRRGLEVAVFTRNHRDYLDEACATSEKHPRQRIAFRASTRWAAAADALREQKPRDLYIAAIGAEGVVEFIADLHAVHLEPAYGQPRTKELLDLVLDSTKGEGLWEKYGKVVETLYVIENCRRLKMPFPMNDLVKLSDDERLSKDYGYSYSVVYARDHR
jgi:hypothetical protein